MKRSRRTLGLAGALAIGGLVLSPIAASADVNKCEKDLAKNWAAVTKDFQKELDKAVNTWLKEEDKLAANLAKGKTLDAGAAKGFNKAAEKMQKSLSKLYLVGQDVSAGGDQSKTKAGKAYGKVADALPTGAKSKCTDEELIQLGHLNTLNFNDTAARIGVLAAVGEAWDLQNALISETVRTFSEAAADRCAVSGVACDPTDPLGDAQCAQNPSNPNLTANAKPDAADVCSPSACPECAIWGRTEFDQLSGNPGGNLAGPCFTTTCQQGVSSAINTFSVNLNATLPVSIAGTLPSTLCDIPEILPDAWSVTGGPSRGVTASLGAISVCVDRMRTNGYIKKAASVLPSVDTRSCADAETVFDDDCNTAGFLTCTQGVNASGVPTTTCLDINIAAAANPSGDGILANLQRLTINNDLAGNPCSTADLDAPGEPNPQIQTTNAATAELYDAGTGGTGVGTFDLVASATVGGTPFTEASVANGQLSGGDVVSAFAAVSDDAGDLLGSTVTDVFIECQ